MVGAAAPNQLYMIMFLQPSPSTARCSLHQNSEGARGEGNKDRGKGKGFSPMSSDSLERSDFESRPLPNSPSRWRSPLNLLVTKTAPAGRFSNSCYGGPDVSFSDNHFHTRGF